MAYPNLSTFLSSEPGSCWFVVNVFKRLPTGWQVVKVAVNWSGRYVSQHAQAALLTAAATRSSPQPAPPLELIRRAHLAAHPTLPVPDGTWTPAWASMYARRTMTPEPMRLSLLRSPTVPLAMIETPLLDLVAEAPQPWSDVRLAGQLGEIVWEAIGRSPLGLVREREILLVGAGSIRFPVDTIAPRWNEPPPVANAEGEMPRAQYIGNVTIASRE